MGISVRGSSYSHISTEALHHVIYQMCRENRKLGVKMVTSRLWALGHRVQRERVRSAMLMLFGERQIHRRLKRRSYHVRSPLSVIHIDGYHGLIR